MEKKHKIREISQFNFKTYTAMVIKCVIGWRCRHIEWKHGNTATQIYPTDFQQNAKKFNEGKTTFSKNGVGATGHP